MRSTDQITPLPKSPRASIFGAPFSDWERTRPSKAALRRTAAAIAMASIAASGAAAAAHAADEKPLKDGWSWTMPDGSKIGQCTDGYHESPSLVKDHEKQLYWVAYGPQNGWKGTVYDLTWPQLQEHLATVFRDDHRATIWGVQGLSSGTIETVLEPGTPHTPGTLTENDCIIDTHELPPGQPNHGTDDDIKPKPVPTSPTTPPPPAPKPTPPVKLPSTDPVVTMPQAPAIVTRTFQVDRAVAKTAKAAAAYAALDDDGKLTRAEGKKLWSSVSERASFVTVKLPAKASAAQVLKAINARTGAVGDVTTTAKLDKLKAGQVVTQAWELSSRASVRAPFGRTGAVAQTYIGRSVVR